MGRKVVLTILTMMLPALVFGVWATMPANAQVSNGSVSGTVYHDIDADGACVGTGEPGEPGIPVLFVTEDGFTRVAQETTADGSFILTAAGLGTWIVSAEPGDGWQVTSQSPVTVVVTSDNPDISGLAFCITQVEGGPSEPMLPESGAFITPGQLLPALAGTAFVGIGILLILYARRNRSDF